MKIRIYYEDTDCGGVVYYANYLRFMERARTEFFRERGLDLGEFHAGGILFVVAEAHVEYLHSARYNDLLEDTTSIVETGGAWLRIETSFDNQDGVACARGWVKLACVDTTGRPRRLPREVRGMEKASLPNW